MNAETSWVRTAPRRSGTPIEPMETRIYQHGGTSHDPADAYPVASIRVPWFRDPKVAPTPAPTPTPTPTPPPPTPTPAPVPTNFAWKTAASTAKKRAEGVSWVADGKLFTTGGFESNALAVSRDVNVYDPATNKWTLAAPTPDTMTHAAAVVDGDTVWVGTFFLRDGVHSSRRVWKYDVSDDKWSEGPQLPEARGAGGLAIVGRELHAFGGLDINQKGRTEHWRLDLDDADARWVTDTPLPEDNNHFGAVTLNGKIYVVGGLHDKVENTANRSTVRTYDPKTRKWGLAASLPLPLAHIGPSTFAAGNAIVVAGGQTNDPNDREVHTRRVLRYDPAADRWRDLPQLPAARKSSNSGFVDGKIIVANGNVTGAASVTDTVWISSASS